MYRDRFFGRLNTRRQAARKRRPSVVEALESRQLLTTFYVDSNLLLSADRDHSGGLSSGDQVTFGNAQPYQQANLTYDAAPTGGDVGAAFSSISQALSSPLVQAGDTIDIAGGTYTDSVTIDKNITLQGEGSVVLQCSKPGGTMATITITGNPDSVTLENLDFTSPSYNAGLLDDGGGTLNLTDVSGSDSFSVEGVTNLNIVRTTSLPQQVYIGPDLAVTVGFATDNGPFASPMPTDTANNWDVVAFQGSATIRFVAANVSVTTGSGSDSYKVQALPNTTITVDGGDPTPPTLPGDSLVFAGGNPNDLSVTSDATGYSGAWTDSSNPPVHYSHFESVGPGPFDEKAQGFDATEGVAYSGTILQFNDATPNVPLADYRVTVDWGDGTTSAGSVVAGGPYANLAVAGTHTYAKYGEYAVSVAISRPGTIETPLSSGGYASPAPLVGTGVTLGTTEGQAIGNPSAVVGTFAHTNGSNLNDNYSATIEWGDGSSSTGTISTLAGNAAEWEVSGSHIYAEDGNYPITVLVNGGQLFPQVVINSQARVAELPITTIGKTITGTTGLALEGGQAFLGSIEQPFGGDNESWQATIDWGDGTTSTGTVILPLGQLGGSPIGWNILGSHIYSAAGTYDIQITITEGGNFESNVKSTAIITGSPLTPNQQFVSNIYGDLLHRAVDQEGMNFWAGRLDGGLSRKQLVFDIIATLEYRQEEVTSLYEHYLHRAVEPAALAADSQLLTQGMTEEQLAAIIVSSDEYFALHGGTNNGFLTALFQDALNRPIEVGATARFDHYLAGGTTRAAVAALVFSSHEYHAEVVSAVYQQLLDRQADALGQMYWTEQLDHGASDEQAIAVIAASEEYFRKA